MTTTSTVVLARQSFLESPRWRDDRIWVSDFYTQRVLSARADGSGRQVEAEVPGQPGGLGWLPDGRLLVASMLDRRVLRREASGELVTHADLSATVASPLNDMVVDPEGRAYVGNFGFDIFAGEPVADAAMHRIDPDGSVTEVAGGLRFPNGAVIIDGDLVVAETFANRLSAFAMAPDGSLGARRDWARFADVPAGATVPEVFAHVAVAADGICADAEGAVWVADPLAQRVVRVLAGQGIVEEIKVGKAAYACALGGADGRTLYVCVARGFHEHDPTDKESSELLAIDVEVPGVAR
jgi:sugar lactone lactonase YvrE